MSTYNNFSMARFPLFQKRVIPVMVSTMLLVFISAMIIFLRHSTHFIADDFYHFTEILTTPFFELLRTPIDVHFAPLHQLASFLIFSASPLNFDVALTFMTLGWTSINLILYRILLRLTTRQTAWVFTLLVGASPVWIHNFIWWSSAAHRIPYLVLQAAAVLFYLRFRDRQQRRDGIFGATMQVLALGFYVKAILFPVIIAALEICLALQTKKLSRGGIKLLAVMVAISALYVTWYLISAPVMRISIRMEVVDIFIGAITLILRFGGLLIFLPIEQPWSAWVSGAFWGALIGLLIWRKPLTAVPIVMLAILMFISYGLTISGRGGIILDFPMAAMRYYGDELVVIALFLSLALTSKVIISTSSQSVLKQNGVLFLILSLIVSYPILSYFSNRALFVKAYNGHQQTHDFMVNLESTLKEASQRSTVPVILDRNFPTFAYGFFGSTLPMAGIFSAVYPELGWLERPQQARGKVYQIRDDGHLGLVVLSDRLDFRDSTSFPDWNIAEDSHRWSNGNHATILFSPRLDHKYEGELIIKGPVLGSQRVVVLLNDTVVTNMRISATDSCCNWSVKFPPALLRSDGLNAFEFELPDAHRPGNGDERMLAIGIQTVEIR